MDLHVFPLEPGEVFVTEEVFVLQNIPVEVWY